MRAFVIEKHLKSVDELPACLSDKAPEPSIKPGSPNVLIDIKSAALNFFDILQVCGKYQHQPPMPFNAGAEFAGIISSNSPIPKGCNFTPGKTRVFGAAQGAFAERIVADWRSLIEIPEGMSYEAASGLFVTYPTSYAALVLRARLQKGEWCLVHAAAGGVGLAAVQIAKALGAKVIATAGSQDKLDVAKRLGGADFTLNYREDGWQKKVMEITKGKGANVIYDPVGMIQPSLKCIAWNGRAVVVGFAAGNIEKIPMNLVLLKNIEITGVHWGEYKNREADQIPKVWSAILELIREGKLRPAVFDPVFDGLEKVPEGLKALGARKTWGKAVVRINKEKQSKL